MSDRDQHNETRNLILSILVIASVPFLIALGIIFADYIDEALTKFVLNHKLLIGFSLVGGTTFHIFLPLLKQIYRIILFKLKH